MKIFVADFETFFSQEYSLSRMTTESYVRDARFQAHMLGYWAPGEMQFPATCTPEMLLTNQALRQRIEDSAVLAHHAHFDGLVLSHHFGLKPKLWLDTLSMARLVWPRLKSYSLDALAAYCGLPAKNVPYNLFKGVSSLATVQGLYEQVADGCQHDCSLTFEIAKRLLPSVPQEELRCIDATIRMFTEPCLELDKGRMEAFLKAEKLRKAKAMLEAGRALGLPTPTTIDEVRGTLAQIETELQSSEKFRQALEAIGYECPMKFSAKQQINIPALAKSDDGMKALQEHPDSRVQALAAARLGVKSTIDETRAERLLDIDTRGPVPLYIMSYATKTLRVGGGDSNNVLNWPRGGEIRKSIKAPPGHRLCIADESQIEYRMLCWVAGQWDKLEALRSGRDLYCEYASEFYQETITKDDKPRRGVGKQGILMGGYGAGKGTMIRTAAAGGYGPPILLSDPEGQRMVDLYRGGHNRVQDFWRWCESVLPILASGGSTAYESSCGTLLRIQDHKIWLPNGTALDYTGLRWATNTDIFPDQEPDGQGFAWWEPTRKGFSRIWGSKLTADIIQALARVLIARAMAIVAPRYRLVLQVYDELVACVPDAIAGPLTPKPVVLKDAMPDTCLHFMLETMVTAPAWCTDLPLEAEGICALAYDK